MATKEKLSHLPLMVITWEDHSSRDDWQNEEQAKTGAAPIVITSVGWLHHETDKVYSLVSCVAEDGDISCQQFILKRATVDVFHVPEIRKKRKRK